MESDVLAIGLVQFAASAQKPENLERAIAGIRQAAKQGARVICLQELFATRYFCQEAEISNFDLAEAIPGPSTETLGNVAKELEVAIIAPVFEKRARGLFHNSAAVIDADGALLGAYRKMHVPDDPGFAEKFYFAPGDSGFQTWKTRHGRIGVCICWDQWFPEAARATALRGADVIFYPTAIGWIPEDREIWEKQYEAWQIMQRSHAIANGCFVAAANRTGVEGDIHFWGRSFVAGPDGEILAQAGEDDAQLVVELDLRKIDEQRQMWPFLRDRRTDAYGELNELGT